jgi:hypothetical protein
MSTNSEYVTKMEALLKKWDADLDALRVQGKKLSTDTRAAYFGRIKELRAGRDAAQKTLHQIRIAAESAEQQMHAGMEVAWDAMQKALEKVSSDLRK